MKITLVALFLNALGALAGVTITNDAASVPTSISLVPHGAPDQLRRSVPAADGCVNGICHPGKRCVLKKCKTESVCVEDPDAPLCYETGDRCIDTSDCCSGGDACAPPIDNPSGQPVCQPDPCLDESLIISPTWGTFHYEVEPQYVDVGIVADLACCRACYATPGCSVWYKFFNGFCSFAISAARNPPVDVSAQCPNGLAGPISLSTGNPGPFGRGPCTDPNLITVH